MKKKARSGPADNDLVVCRCESVNLGDLRLAIQRSSVSTVNQLKKLTRAGMGPCQGRTCAKTIEQILKKEAGAKPGTSPYNSRPPVRNISVAALAAVAEQYQEPAGPVSVAMLRTSSSDDPGSDQTTDQTDST